MKVEAMPTKPPTYRSKYQAPPKSNDAVRGSSAARGYDRDWQRLRAEQLTEFPICFAPRCGQPATCVDHIEPVTKNPARRLDKTNLRSCCGLHHARLTANWTRSGINELDIGGENK
jgi:hypothetical protein